MPPHPSPLSLLRCTSSRIAASATPSSSAAAAAAAAAVQRSFSLLRSQSSFPSSTQPSPNRTNANRTPAMMGTQKRTFVPYVLDEGSRGQTDLYSRLLKERVICMSEVEDSMSTIIVASLLYLDAADPTKPIYLYINSPGGVVTSGLAIYDTFISAPVHTFCIGQAASMGSLLLAGGAAGHRYILPNARVMIHQPSGGAGGHASDFEITAKEILRMRAALTDIYRVHCSFPGETAEQARERFDTAMERDRFLTPEESKAFGLVDHIQDSRKRIGEEEEEEKNDA
ncbi:Clp protease-domain-containing protein [Mrakia frigida]|uniref:ATP-dependent Clp protease proteolytic subunit n=1 Tax=Mrakia frigida TaxID=29902 RepID=UPI003FCBF259